MVNTNKTLTKKWSTNFRVRHMYVGLKMYHTLINKFGWIGYKKMNISKILDNRNIYETSISGKPTRLVPLIPYYAWPHVILTINIRFAIFIVSIKNGRLASQYKFNTCYCCFRYF